MSGWRYMLSVATLALAGLVLEVFVGHAVSLQVPLPELPFRLGPWIGRVEDVSPEYLQRARPDEVLYRRYVDTEGHVVFVYVGYYARQASRGQVQAVCSGECDVLKSGTRPINLGDAVATVNSAVVRQDARLMAVLYWYQSAGQVSHDRYRGKLEQLTRALLRRRSEGALVRIAVPIVTEEDEAWQRGAALARILFPALRRHLPE